MTWFELRIADRNEHASHLPSSAVHSGDEQCRGVFMFRSDTKFLIAIQTWRTQASLERGITKSHRRAIATKGNRHDLEI